MGHEPTWYYGRDAKFLHKRRIHSPLVKAEWQQECTNFRASTYWCVLFPFIFTVSSTTADRIDKARPNFYVMNKTADWKTTFKFLGANLMVRRVQPNTVILSAHDRELHQGALARHKITRAVVKNFHFRSGQYPGLLTMQCWAPYQNVCFHHD